MSTDLSKTRKRPERPDGRGPDKATVSAAFGNPPAVDLFKAAVRQIGRQRRRTPVQPARAASFFEVEPELRLRAVVGAELALSRRQDGSCRRVGPQSLRR
jgi:hypothetical protein